MTKVLLVAIFILVLILYFPVLNTYFSQDDFFHFRASQTDGSISSFIQLFGFPTFDSRGYGFYRPLFREGLYNLYFIVFGLNHLPFRVFQFILHFINISLVYILVGKIFKNRLISFLSAFFFGISSVNVATFYYLAGGIQAMGATMFTLLTLIFFLDQKKLLSLLTFLLALSSHELASSLPALLFLILWLKFPSKKVARETVSLWPYLLILLIYLYLDIKVIGFSHEEVQYQFSLSIKKLANTLSWYAAWAMGIPEMFVDFLEPGFKFNPNLFIYWGGISKIIITAFVASLVLLGLSLVSIFKKKISFKDKLFLFLPMVFLISLSPVILLPLHKSTYYLSVGLWSFWAFNGLVLTKGPKLISLMLAILLIILNMSSIKLGEQTYWAASRGRAAQKLLNQLKSTHPTFPSGATIYYLNDPTYPYVAKDWGSTSKQAKMILNNQDAIQLLYNDPTIKVFYEDDGVLESQIKGAFRIIAKLN